MEQELQETQKTAGLPISLPYDSNSLKLTPQMTRRQPPKPLFHKLETELSDTEISDLSPDAEGGKTATVERKIPVKDELDCIPQHELLDNSVTKSKGDLGMNVVLWVLLFKIKALSDRLVIGCLLYTFVL